MEVVNEVLTNAFAVTTGKGYLAGVYGTEGATAKARRKSGDGKSGDGAVGGGSPEVKAVEVPSGRKSDTAKERVGHDVGNCRVYKCGMCAVLKGTK